MIVQTRTIADNVFSSSAVPLVDLVAMSEVPHPIPFRTRSLSPPEPMVLRLKARESRSPPGLPGGQPNEAVILGLPRFARLEARLEPFFLTILPFAAGWSSPVARQAHNLKVAGSNPAPATKIPLDNKDMRSAPRGAFCIRAFTSTPHQHHNRKTAAARIITQSQAAAGNSQLRASLLTAIIGS